MSTYNFLFYFSFTISSSIFIIFLIKKLSPRNLKNPPPSPPKLPIFGNLFQLGSTPHSKLRTLSQTYGPLMLLRFGSVPVLIVSSSDTAKHIMKTHDLVFSNRPKFRTFQKLLYNSKDIANAPYGEYWRQIKSICTIHLLSNKMVKSFREVREEETRVMVQKVYEDSKSSSVINLSEILIQLSNDVTCKVVLGKKYGNQENKFKELLNEFTELLGFFDIGDYVVWMGWWSGLVKGLDGKVEKVAREFDCFLDQIVKEHNMDEEESEKKNYVQRDFVDVLLSIQKDKSVGFQLDSVAVKAIILDMFAAGTHTTYTALEWAMSELLRHPKIMTKLQNEVRTIASNYKTDMISEPLLDKLHYLKAVIKETLRLHPPIPLLVPRKSTQDVKINGYDIDSGTQVLINAFAIQRDPKIWDDPEEFKPERFLNSCVDFKGQDFELIPFGSGRRVCPGIQFAMSINEIALANLLFKFDWSLPDGLRSEELDMSETCGLTICRENPLYAIASITPYSSI